MTGASRGIGRAIAERLVGRGDAVILTDIDGEAAERTAREVGALAGLPHDVRDPDAHHEIAEVATARAPLACWVNNAGVAHDGPLADLTDDRLREMVEVNLLGVLWGTRAALAAFGPGGGDIVNLGSVSAFGPVPGLGVYAATKAAVVSLTMSLSWEAPDGVRTHVLCPDGVDTDLVAGMDDAGVGKALVHSGAGLLSVADVADAAVAMIGRDRVVQTLPGWRGALGRLSALGPSRLEVLLPVFTWWGGRRVRAGRR